MAAITGRQNHEAGGVARGKPCRPFAIVREAESEALKNLSPNASKLWIAIRFGRNESEAFCCGCRDFTNWGIGRDAASKPLKELVEAGLLKLVEQGSFGKRGRRSKYTIVNTRAREEEESGRADNNHEQSPRTSTTAGDPVRKPRQQTRKESGYSDIPKDTSSTSSPKSKEEEVSLRPIEDGTCDSENERSSSTHRDREDQAFEATDEAHKADRDAWRKMDRLIDQIAKPQGFSTIAFIEAFGGSRDTLSGKREAAYKLCHRYMTGAITKQELFKHRSENRWSQR